MINKDTFHKNLISKYYLSKPEDIFKQDLYNYFFNHIDIEAYRPILDTMYEIARDKLDWDHSYRELFIEFSDLVPIIGAIKKTIG
jgi:hypothetical protein